MIDDLKKSAFRGLKHPSLHIEICVVSYQLDRLCEQRHPLGCER